MNCGNYRIDICLEGYCADTVSATNGTPSPRIVVAVLGIPPPNIPF